MSTEQEERPSNWHRHHVAVEKGALQMVRNALRTDAENGRTVRAEMLEMLDATTVEIDAARAALVAPAQQKTEPTNCGDFAKLTEEVARDAMRYRWLRDQAKVNDWDEAYELPSISSWDYKPGPELNERHPNFDAAIDAAMQKEQS